MANNGKSGWLKWLVILLIVGGVGGAVAWHFFNKGDDGPQYQTADIARGDGVAFGVIYHLMQVLPILLIGLSGLKLLAEPKKERDS